jgi:aspartyl protease family protein
VDTVPYSPEKPQPLEKPLPLPRVITGGAEASSVQRYDGHFFFAAMVNGRPVSMLFDTGASMVTLRAEDAGRLGIPVGQLTFSQKVATANGIGLVAATVIGTLTIGAVTQHDVPALVASPGTLRENLLGQSFLNKLQAYSVENNHVVLKAY